MYTRYESMKFPLQNQSQDLERIEMKSRAPFGKVLGSLEAMVCLLPPVCFGLKSDGECLMAFTGEGFRL